MREVSRFNHQHDGSRNQTQIRERDVLINRIKIELPPIGTAWKPPSEAVLSSTEEITEKNSGSTRVLNGVNKSISTDFLFSQLPISSISIKALQGHKFQNLTRIQFGAIPHAIAGFDVIGEAPTGSGKTLAYVVPAIELLWRENWTHQDGLGVLVLTPTRELALQVFDVFSLFEGFRFSAMAVFGGKFIDKEQNRMEHIHILIGTPGRVQQHLEQTASLHTENLRMVILDEADKLIELGFLKTTEDILESLPPCEERQNLMFSATLTSSVRKLAKSFCRNGKVHIISHVEAGLELCQNPGDLGNKAAIPSQTVLKQSYCVVELYDKINILYAFLCKHLRSKVIVFVPSIKQVRFIYESFRLLKTGGRLLELHGNQDQNKRLNVFDEFSRRKKATVLITTDVVGRGIDFPQVDWVVQLDCPPDVDTYIHRVGRTARGLHGTGCSVIYLLPSELEFINRLKEKRIDITQVKIRPNQTFDISGKLRGICANNALVSHLATKSFRSYFKSVELMADRQIFNFNTTAAHAQQFAESLGLIRAPPLPKPITRDTSNAVQQQDSDTDQIPTSYVISNPEMKAKNKSRLQRLKEKILASKIAERNEFASAKHAQEPIELENDDEEGSRNKKRTSRLLRKRDRMKQIREEGVLAKPETLIEDADVFVIDTADNKADYNSHEQVKDWRDDPNVKRALKKKRLVIRADGTAKLKGAAKLIQRDHVIYNDDDTALDAQSFAGVVASMGGDV